MQLVLTRRAGAAREDRGATSSPSTRRVARVRAAARRAATRSASRARSGSRWPSSAGSGIVVPGGVRRRGARLRRARAWCSRSCGRTLAPEPLLSTVAARRAGRCCSAAARRSRRRWLPRGRRGRAAARARATRSARSRYDLRRVATRAERDGATAGASRGEKILVLDGHVADALVVVARTRGRRRRRATGITLFLVPRDARGLDGRRAQTRVDGRNAALVRLDGVDGRRRAPSLGAVGRRRGAARAGGRPRDRRASAPRCSARMQPRPSSARSTT